MKRPFLPPDLVPDVKISRTRALANHERWRHVAKWRHALKVIVCGGVVQPTVELIHDLDDGALIHIDDGRETLDLSRPWVAYAFG